jgi:hypothetical protein
LENISPLPGKKYRPMSFEEKILKHEIETEEM